VQIISHPSDNFPTQASIVSRVVDHLGDDYRPSHVILDGADYSDESTLLDEFRDVAFSWTRDRPTDRTPSHVRRLMQREECANLIWFSRKAIGYDEVLFTWVVAHELRHVYQSRHDFPRADIRSVVHELRRRQEFTFLPPSVFAPEEIDSDACALRVAKEICGAEYVSQFLSAHPLPRCPYPAYLKLLECVQLKCLNELGVRNEAG
jgi:hypothetical protein